MKYAALTLALVLAASPAFAQLPGGLGRRIGQAQDAKKKADDLHVSDKEEREIGEAVSEMLRRDYGVMQNREVTKYVSLVGTVLAQASTRPNLDWQFIVLDTDGINAFASPGGIVHITKGALGLIDSEAELAGVLGHEIAHISEKHTAKSIEKGARAGFVIDAAPGTKAWVDQVAQGVYVNIVQKGFDRGDEEEADSKGIALANKVGYNPAGLGTFLTSLSNRNAERKSDEGRNGLFASHPETKGRIDKLTRQIKSDKLTATATAASRYTSTIDWQAKPLSEIAALVAGSRGLAGDEGAAKPAEPAPKKGLGGLGGKLGLSTGKSSQSTQASASAGNRAVDPDRMLKGGGNPQRVTVTLTPAEIAAFKKGIA